MTASSLSIKKVRSYWVVFVRVSPNLRGGTSHYQFTSRKQARAFARNL